MTLIMPREKTWSKDGVTITYLMYSTMLSLKVKELLTDEFRFPSPTIEDPDAHAIPRTVQMFYLAMPAIIRVVVTDGAPMWGEMLKEEIERHDWLDDPVADYKRVNKLLPYEVIEQADAGYLATREKAQAAPPELRNEPPVNPELDLEAMAAGGGQKDLSNPTMPGGTSLMPKSSPVSLISSSRQRKAK